MFFCRKVKRGMILPSSAANEQLPEDEMSSGFLISIPKRCQKMFGEDQARKFQDLRAMSMTKDERGLGRLSPIRA